MAKIELSTGFKVEVVPTPLLGLQSALERLMAEERSRIPQPPSKEVKSATGEIIRVEYRPPPPGREPKPEDGEAYEFYERWLQYIQERGRIQTEIDGKTRQTTLRYALIHSLRGVRLPTRRRRGLGWLLWLPLRLLDVTLAFFSGQPIPPSDWEAKARHFGLDWKDEIERRLAYYYSVVLGSTLDANLVLGAAVLMGPPEGGVENAKRLFRHPLERTEAERLGEPGAERPDNLQPLETLAESGPGKSPDSA